VLGLESALIGAIATLILATLAVATRALTPAGGGVAAAFGIVIVVFLGFPFLALLILFLGASVLATRYRFAEKQARQLQEGAHGERGVPNVMAHILIPTGLAIAGGWPSPLLSVPTVAVLYTSALAFGAADTFASEFGVLSGRARSILHFREVAPGTNGGVSGLGEAWALEGALLTAVVALGLFRLFGTGVASLPALIVIATVSGFLGCQVDSVLGETLENRGYLTKGSTNFLGMLSAVAIAAGGLIAIGAVR
jgi:uncharacterized protein (TIGR00297 family)